jgi:hypothetical protein
MVPAVAATIETTMIASVRARTNGREVMVLNPFIARRSGSQAKLK